MKFNEKDIINNLRELSNITDLLEIYASNISNPGFLIQKDLFISNIHKIIHQLYEFSKSGNLNLNIQNISDINDYFCKISKNKNSVEYEITHRSQKLHQFLANYIIINKDLLLVDEVKSEITNMKFELLEY